MLLCAWGAENLEDEPEVRTVLFASGTILSYLNSAFVPIAAFPASEAPNWKIGSKLYLAFALVSLAIFIAIHFGFVWKDKRRARKVTAQELTESSGPHEVQQLTESFPEKV